MTRRTSIASLVLIAAFFSAGTLARAQRATDASGNWSITTSGESFTTGPLRLAQSGTSIAGGYGRNGHIDGTFKPGTTQVDANWDDARGTGWMTIVFAADGNRFSGVWGYPARSPAGSFVGTRVAAVVLPLNSSYEVRSTGGATFESRRMTLRQLGFTVVGNFGTDTQVNGTMSPDGSTLAGTWKGLNGDGWIRLEFAPDGKSFQGQWGLASDARVRGSIAGSTALRPAQTSRAQLWVKGLWQIASSGEAFAARILNLHQDGRTVVGFFRGGHMQGTLVRGSRVLAGRWKGNGGSGDVVLKFGSDGKTFQGTWTANGNSGSIVGKRVIAASPALRS